ncbi:MAG: helix-turn-helix transcriptional regulator [Cyanobacteria bacterium SZAS LIN-2]|nr:helix-turn-helix transcriptional regulator [Cyanobacteria bacterium SZAS LIN-2]MBS2006086.1 helix-turn-helix transcriptional regulator [Cyanobacteria bacterium SZAS TMP-1]
MNMEKRSICPIACTLDLLGDKWTLLVLRDIVIFKKSRFEQFLDSPEKIATNILTDRLHKLEKAGLITKAPYGNHRLRMAYTATEKGKSTVPLMKEIVKWGLANIEGTGAMPPPAEAESPAQK